MDIYDWFAQTISSFDKHSHKHQQCTHRIFMAVEWNEKRYEAIPLSRSSLVINRCSFYFWNLLLKRSVSFLHLAANSEHNNVIFERFQSKSVQNFSSSEKCDCSKQKRIVKNMLIFVWIIDSIYFRILWLIKFINFNAILSDFFPSSWICIKNNGICLDWPIHQTKTAGLKCKYNASLCHGDTFITHCSLWDCLFIINHDGV